MGTDLIPIGNHTISFSERGFHEIANEIVGRLMSVRHDPFSQEIFFNYQQEDEYYSFEKDRNIYIIRGLNPDYTLLRIDEFRVRYFLGFRYHHWCAPSTQEAIEMRNKWRMYLWQVEHALGGDRVIYLADNAHHLEQFDQDIPFSQIEASLFNAYGPPSASLEEAFEKGYTQGGYQGGYFIDRFRDIIHI